MHVVDATLFFSPTSGGVKRYLLAKHEWMRTHTNWRHSLVVPGESSTHCPGDISTIAGGRVPGTFNYRLPLNPLRWSRAIDALEPDLIEVGDVFHPAWAAARVASRRDVPLVAFCHSDFPHIVGRRLGATWQKLIERYVRLTYSRFDQVLAPSRFTCDYLQSIGVSQAAWQPLGVDVDTFHPSRRGRDLRKELGLSPDTRVLVFAGRFSTEKNIPLLTATFARLGSPYHLLLIGGDLPVREDLLDLFLCPLLRSGQFLPARFDSGDQACGPGNGLRAHLVKCLRDPGVLLGEDGSELLLGKEDGVFSIELSVFGYLGGRFGFGRELVYIFPRGLVIRFGRRNTEIGVGGGLCCHFSEILGMRHFGLQCINPCFSVSLDRCDLCLHGGSPRANRRRLL